MPTKYDLQLFQRLPLDMKIAKTKLRIREWVSYYDTDGLWKPTKDGLGMKHCIDEINKIYGKDFIRY